MRCSTEWGEHDAFRSLYYVNTVLFKKYTHDCMIILNGG